MGMFSWDCKSCGHPALSRNAVESKNGWMNEVVAFTENGTRLVGTYDGYGRVGDHEVSFDDPCLYHQACWEAAGRPEYSSPSVCSADQGWFYEDEVHNSPPPAEPGFFKYEG